MIVPTQTNTPTTQAHTLPLSFEQRLTRVQAEVKSRVSRQPTQHRNAAQARMWGNWIRRNVLEVTAS